MLPAEISSFVGRERELSALKELLAGVRLLTLTGPGGCGKTRLALRAAREVAEEFERGVWWVELASLSGPEMVAQAAAGAAGVREVPGRSLIRLLAERLGEDRALLVLDNCEHLIGACAALSETLLRSCPGLSVLATSREALGVAGETVWLVSPLSVPSRQSAEDPSSLERYEAVRLFAERARATASGFEPIRQNLPAIARVCRRLDGIPLAVELAAARTKMLSVEQIAGRLEEDVFRLLTDGSRTAPSRQRTLRATMDWSYGLLSEDEKVLFHRLATFSGGFILEAAEGVCAGEGLERDEVLDLLSRLVDKSLVVVHQHSGEARYGLLETVRQYARERLAESGEAATVEMGHARFFLRLAEESEPAMLGAGQLEWLERLEREHANLRAALGWLLEERETERGLRFAAALVRFWWFRGHYTEGRRWLEEFLDLPGRPAGAAVRAMALHALGVMISRSADWSAGEGEAARSRLEESLKIYRRLGDEPRVAAVLRDLGRLGIQAGDWKRARSFLNESLGLERRSGNERGVGLTCTSLGYLALLRGEHGPARTQLQQGLEILKRTGDPEEVRTCLWHLIMLACEEGDYAAARALSARMMEGAPILQYRYAAPLVLLAYARLALGEGRPACALKLAGAADRLRHAVGTSVGPTLRAFMRRGLQPAWAALGSEEGRAAFEEGRTLTLEEAIAHALEESPSGERQDTPPVSGATGEILTRREVEVLRLIGEGMTDAQVAGRLFISTRTVNAHVRSILRKLGVRSRAAAARLAAERGLLG